MNSSRPISGMPRRLEYETSVLARKVGLKVPETKCQKLSKSGTTFFSKRFDREDARRIHYASAMTMLGAIDGEEDHSCLEIAEWLSQNSAAPEEDLKELWRRMVFSYIIGNTDDHLRNHGFLLTPKGWRLAPMFDVNPNPNGGEHALDLGDLIKDADYYRLTKAEARSEYTAIKSACQKVVLHASHQGHGHDVEVRLGDDNTIVICRPKQ